MDNEFRDRVYMGLDDNRTQEAFLGPFLMTAFNGGAGTPGFLQEKAIVFEGYI